MPSSCIACCSIGLLLLVTCECNRPQPSPKAASKSTLPSSGKIHVVETLGGAKIVKYVRPVYPKEARKARRQGLIRLRALITKTGKVTELEVLSGDLEFVPAAIDAVKQWRYASTRLNNEAVEVRSTIDVNFTLNQ